MACGTRFCGQWLTSAGAISPMPPSCLFGQFTLHLRKIIDHGRLLAIQNLHDSPSQNDTSYRKRPRCSHYYDRYITSYGSIPSGHSIVTKQRCSEWSNVDGGRLHRVLTTRDGFWTVWERPWTRLPQFYFPYRLMSDQLTLRHDAASGLFCHRPRESQLSRQMNLTRHSVGVI